MSCSMTPLDQALEAAKQDQTKGEAFYSLFLNSEVFIPTHDAPATSTELHRAQQGETYLPYVVESQGTAYLPVFDTYDRLIAWTHGIKMTFIKMAAHALVRSSLDTKLHLALNVGTLHTKVFTPGELVWLRNVFETQKPKAFQVPAGTRVFIGAPAKVVDGLEESLRNCFQRNDEIDAAYLGQVHFQFEGAKPELFLVLKLAASGQTAWVSIREDIGIALRGYLKDGENLTLQVFNGEGIGADVVRAVEPFFTKTN